MLQLGLEWSDDLGIRGEATVITQRDFLLLLIQICKYLMASVVVYEHTETLNDIEDLYHK